VKVGWYDVKNLANQRKHGVSFEEAEELLAPGADTIRIISARPASAREQALYHSYREGNL